MNKSQHALHRLFRAASRAPREAPAQIPFATECRVLSLWRAGADAEGDVSGLLLLFRRALVLACVLAVAALVFNLRELTQEPNDDDDVVIINSPISLTYLP